MLLLASLLAILATLFYSLSISNKELNKSKLKLEEQVTQLEKSKADFKIQAESSKKELVALQDKLKIETTRANKEIEEQTAQIFAQLQKAQEINIQYREQIRLQELIFIQFEKASKAFFAEFAPNTKETGKQLKECAVQISELPRLKKKGHQVAFRSYVDTIQKYHVSMQEKKKKEKKSKTDKEDEEEKANVTGKRKEMNIAFEKLSLFGILPIEYFATLENYIRAQIKYTGNVVRPRVEQARLSYEAALNFREEKRSEVTGIVNQIHALKAEYRAISDGSK